jgi:MFS family permease
MQWQVWTAFGIMVGYAADVGFYFVPDHGIELGLNWRLMLGSAGLPAVIVCCLIFLAPESPRWYLNNGKQEKAYSAIARLRYEKVQAARDLFYMQVLLEAEKEAMSIGKTSRIKEILTVRRNRNAMIASEVVMFMQQ